SREGGGAGGKRGEDQGRRDALVPALHVRTQGRRPILRLPGLGTLSAAHGGVVLGADSVRTAPWRASPHRCALRQSGRRPDTGQRLFWRPKTTAGAGTADLRLDLPGGDGTQVRGAHDPV